MIRRHALDPSALVTSKERRKDSEASPSMQGLTFNASSFVSSIRSAIHVTNAPTKYRLIHGSEFRDLLDARDKVLEHGFNIIVNCEPA
jgi:hypothetical protein